MSKLAHLLLVVALLPLSVSMPAPAQEVGLSPTLANIKRTQTVRLGYREASPPFSYLDQANRPIGYSLELCKAIVEEIGAEVEQANLKIDYVKVTPETRIPAVLNNKIDLECGSTTASPDRARRVAFSPMIYVAGTKLMVPKGFGCLRHHRSQGQDDRRNQGYDQRTCDRNRRQEVLAGAGRRRHDRPRAVLPVALRRKGAGLRHRRHPSLWVDRAPSGAGQVQGGG